MRARWFWSGLAILALVSFANAGQGFVKSALTSGLQVGESAPAFHVQDITGPNKGRSLCYRWQYGVSPVVCVFARETSDSLTSLVKKIDEKIAEKGSKLKSFVVVLTDDGDKTSKTLTEIAGKNEIKKVPLTIIEGVQGPESYKIAENADITIMMWKGTRVQSNFAFEKGKFTDKDVETVLGDLPKILEAKK